jgi:hypothetical protein
VHFCKQPTCFQAPRLPRACNSPYFYLFASLILAKADCCPVVQGQSFSRLYSLFHLQTLLFEPFFIQWSPVGDIWLIVIVLGPFQHCFRFFLLVVSGTRWFPVVWWCLWFLWVLGRWLVPFSCLVLVAPSSCSVGGPCWLFLSVVSVSGSVVNCLEATQGQ